MRHFISYAGLGRKSKGQQKSTLRLATSPSLPNGEWEKEKDAEASDSLPHCHFDLGSRDVSRLNSTSQSNIEDTSACKGDAITGRPASIHSDGPGHDSPSSSGTLTEQSPASLFRRERSKSLFSTLSNKLRSRARGPLPPCHTPVPARTQDDLHQISFHPRAVPVVLSDDPVSKERREAALRARGLLPSRQPRDLSALEADADRRIDALRKNDSPVSDPENGHSDANEIAQSWRIRNSGWLFYTPPNSDSPENPMTEDASPIDTSSHPEGPSEPPTLGADPSASVPPADPSSTPKSLSLGSPTRSLKAASSSGSICQAQLSRAALLSSTGPDELMLSSDLPTTLVGVTEDMTADLASGLPAPSETSCTAVSQVAETPEVPAPYQRSKSPSLQSEDLQPIHSLDQLPSESRPSEPHNVVVQARPTIPPIYILSTTSDTLLASPTTPTLSQSGCYSSSETDDGSPTIDNGELIGSSISPAVKNGEGSHPCPETILEGSEPLSDVDVDPFHSPPSPSLLTVIPSPTEDGRATPRRTRTTPLLSRLKSRASTLGSVPSSALSKSASVVNLRRKMSSPLFGQARPLSTVSHLSATPRSPPPSPLFIKMYDERALSAEASGIIDDEARRLSELAFLT